MKISINSNQTFWRKLYERRAKGEPFFVLAPMANVTDAAFRKMIAKYGKPDVMWTEFVSADGLMSAGKKNLLVDLKFSPKERPIVAQLFSGYPEAMRGAAKIVAKLGFDGIDINMGCPDRAIEKQSGGAAMMKNPENALAVLRAARDGVKVAKGSNKNIPVTVKTRIGYNKVDMGWLRLLLEQRPPLPALTIHLRTRKEMSDVPAHWEIMPDIVGLRDEVQADIDAPERTLIIGNGDIVSLADAREKVLKTGCDGAMVGRGIFGRPWFFSDRGERANYSKRTIEFETPEKRLKIMLEHATIFERMFGGKSLSGRVKNFAVMKKHFKAYVSGWDGAKELRVKLMEAETLKEVKDVILSGKIFP